MGTLATYLLKATLLLALFYIFNKVLLSRDSFHRLNRISWLAIIVLAHLLPLLESSLFLSDLFAFEPTTSTIDGSSSSLTAISVDELSTFTNNPLSAVTAIGIILYIVVAFGVLIYRCYQYLRLFRLILPQKADLHYSIAGSTSTNNSICASEKYIQMLEEAKQRIGLQGNVRFIVHESELSPFSWFNFVVVSKADLELDGEAILIHELSHVKNKDSIDVLVADLLTITHWFNPSSWLIKKEIEQTHEYQADDSVLQAGVDARSYQYLLIKKNSNNQGSSKKSSKAGALLVFATKCLYVIPLTLIAFTGFANDKVSSVFEQISDAKVSEIFATHEVSEQDSTQTTVESKTKLIEKARIVISISENKDGAIIEINNKPYTGKIEDLGKYLKSMDIFNPNQTVLFKVDPNTRMGIVTYVQDGVRGDIQKITYANDTEKDMKSTTKVDGQEVTGIPKDVLTVLNGKIITYEEFKKMDVNDIAEISVLKDASATKLYGPKASRDF